VNENTVHVLHDNSSKSHREAHAYVRKRLSAART
jgi:hypothetical protein